LSSEAGLRSSFQRKLEALFNSETGNPARHSSESWRRFSTAKLVIQFLLSSSSFPRKRESILILLRCRERQSFHSFCGGAGTSRARHSRAGGRRFSTAKLVIQFLLPELVIPAQAGIHLDLALLL
jgi:hypothetical protein